ncbi:MAG: hypothetical protein M3082_11645 [Candidatus Dormibacteraeota bacterium]|nr:hypothetical protein [Candidatus Dormibacteraeota bacterium]
MGAAMNAFAVPEDGVIPQVFRDWQQVQGAEAQLHQLSTQVADGLQSVLDDPTLHPEERDNRHRQNKDLFDAAERQTTKDFQASIARVKSGLTESATSDFKLAEPSERALIRAEIDKLAAAATVPPASGYGEGYRPGKSMLGALTDIVKSNPGRYGAEVSDYATTLMTAAGEGEMIKALKVNVMLLTPANSPKSQAARAALRAMEASKIEGMPAALSFVARQRVAAVGQPAQPGLQSRAFRTQSGRIQ